LNWSIASASAADVDVDIDSYVKQERFSGCVGRGRCNLCFKDLRMECSSSALPKYCGQKIVCADLA